MVVLSVEARGAEQCLFPHPPMFDNFQTNHSFFAHSRFESFIGMYLIFWFTIPGIGKFNRTGNSIISIFSSDIAYWNNKRWCRDGAIVGDTDHYSLVLPSHRSFFFRVWDPFLNIDDFLSTIENTFPPHYFIYFPDLNVRNISAFLYFYFCVFFFRFSIVDRKHIFPTIYCPHFWSTIEWKPYPGGKKRIQKPLMAKRCVKNMFRIAEIKEFWFVEYDDIAFTCSHTYSLLCSIIFRAFLEIRMLEHLQIIVYWL